MKLLQACILILLWWTWWGFEIPVVLQWGLAVRHLTNH
jgi:hypothetical protein